jgi:hypothetical protein
MSRWVTKAATILPFKSKIDKSETPRKAAICTGSSCASSARP